MPIRNTKIFSERPSQSRNSNRQLQHLDTNFTRKRNERVRNTTSFPACAAIGVSFLLKLFELDVCPFRLRPESVRQAWREARPTLPSETQQISGTLKNNQSAQDRVYCCVVKNRRVMGWGLSEHLTIMDDTRYLSVILGDSRPSPSCFCTHHALKTAGEEAVRNPDATTRNLTG